MLKASLINDINLHFVIVPTITVAFRLIVTLQLHQLPTPNT